MKDLHTFAICAYKESPYLPECIKSLLSQGIRSNIIMSTSTPCDYIEDLADKYHLPLFVNQDEAGITQDWNFAMSKVNTRYVTLAHQDDVYEPDYSHAVISRLEASQKPLIAFSDYYEIREGVRTYTNKNLKIKSLMLSPLRIKAFKGSKFIRRRILSMGDPIGAPAVTFALNNLPSPLFLHGFRSAEDWEAWERISRLKGDFIYIHRPLMGHRIHQDSETSKIIGEGKRQDENYIMFKKFWPAPIAKALNKFYGASEKSNT